MKDDNAHVIAWLLAKQRAELEATRLRARAALMKIKAIKN